MRNLIIIIVIISLFIGGAVFFDMYITKLTDDMLEMLEAAESVEAIEKLTDEWDSRSSIAELMIDHGEIDILNQYLWAMQVEIQYDYDEYMESKKLAKEMFNHIRERNVFGFDNIM